MIPIAELSTMTKPNRPSAGDPNTRIRASIVPRIALKRVKRLARTISASVRLVRSPRSFASPRAARSATSVAVSPVGAVRGRSVGMVPATRPLASSDTGPTVVPGPPGPRRPDLYEMGKLPLEGALDSADAGPDDGDPRPVPAGARAGPGPRGRVHRYVRGTARRERADLRSRRDRAAGADRDPRGARVAAEGPPGTPHRHQPVALPRRRDLPRGQCGDGRLDRPDRRRRPAAVGLLARLRRVPRARHRVPHPGARHR